MIKELRAQYKICFIKKTGVKYTNTAPKASLLLAGEVDLLIVEFVWSYLHHGEIQKEDRRQWAQWWKGAELHKAYNETQTIRS